MMYIVEVRENPKPKDMPENAQRLLRGGNRFSFVDGESTMLGTSPRANKRLVFIESDLMPSDLLDFANNDENDENGKPIKVDLGLEVVAREDEPVDQSLLLPYFNDEVIFDDEGNEIDTQPITDLTDKLQTWAGKAWIY